MPSDAVLTVAVIAQAQTLEIFAVATPERLPRLLKHLRDEAVLRQGRIKSRHNYDPFVHGAFFLVPANGAHELLQQTFVTRKPSGRIVVPGSFRQLGAHELGEAHVDSAPMSGEQAELRARDHTKR